MKTHTSLNNCYELIAIKDAEISSLERKNTELLDAVKDIQEVSATLLSLMPAGMSPDMMEWKYLVRRIWASTTKPINEASSTAEQKGEAKP